MKKYKCIKPTLPFKEGDKVIAKKNFASKTYTVSCKSVVGIIDDQDFKTHFKQIL